MALPRLSPFHLPTGMLAALGLLIGPPVQCQEYAFEAIEVKAAYILNFIRFVEWPPEAFADDQSPLIIGIQEGDPIKGILDHLVRTEIAGGHTIEVRSVADGSDTRECHVLYISPSAGHAAEPESLAGTPILTVGDLDPSEEQNLMIAFFVEDQKLRFEVNTDAIRKSGLQVSSKLLRLARLPHSRE